MKDTRALKIKYYELKVKLTDDLNNTKSSAKSLLTKSLNKTLSQEDQEFHKTWHQLVAIQLASLEEADGILNAKIKELGLEAAVNELLTEREARQVKFQEEKKLELAKELEGLPE